MQREPTAINAPPSGSVTGLGVCDALRVELDPVQVPWLVDELERMTSGLEEAVRPARAARADDDAAEPELAAREYDLRLLRMMRASLPPVLRDARVAFVGPSGIVCRLVRASMRAAAAVLREIVDESIAEPGRRRRLSDTAAAASAWVQTFLACEAVTLFNFDTDADPSQHW
jgi:hypothetical protein